MSKRVCVAATLIATVACGGGDSTSTSTPTSPTPTAAVPSITEFVTGLQAMGGTAAARTTGARPAASGGPAVAATAQGATSNAATTGGSSLVRLNAASAFSTVLMSVTEASPDAFYTLTLPAATTDAMVVVQFSRAIPGGAFQTVFSVQAPGGLTGAPSSIANTVAPAATAARLELTFSPNPVPCVVGPPLSPAFPGFIFRWPLVTFLRETNGIGVTVTNLTISACRAGACGPDVPAPPTFVDEFTGRGPSGLRIEGNGLAHTSPDGFSFSSNPVGVDLDFTYIGTDDRGNRVTASGRSTRLGCQ